MDGMQDIHAVFQDEVVHGGGNQGVAVGDGGNQELPLVAEGIRELPLVAEGIRKGRLMP